MLTHHFAFKLFVILGVFLFQSVVAQDIQTNPTAPKLYNNAIYASVGIGGLWLPGTIYYERMLKQQMWDRGISSFAKVGTGSVAHWEGHSEYVLAQYGMLTGIKKSHFEASIGLVYFYRGDMYNGPQTSSSTYYYEDGSVMNVEEKTPIAPFEWLSGSIGYRLQKPGGHSVFRTGLGFPEAVYVSWGFSL